MSAVLLSRVLPEAVTGVGGGGTDRLPFPPDTCSSSYFIPPKDCTHELSTESEDAKSTHHKEPYRASQQKRNKH